MSGRTSGPVPEHQRRRRNKESKPRSTGERKKVLWPAIPPQWHSIAKMLYSSAQSSGQTDFYQQSDVAYLYFVCDQVDYYMRSGEVVPMWERDEDGKFVLDDEGEKVPMLDEHGVQKRIATGKRSAMMLKSIFDQFEALLISEGDRRRLRMELKEPEPDEEPPEMIILADYKNAAHRVS